MIFGSDDKKLSFVIIQFQFVDETETSSTKKLLTARYLQALLCVHVL